MYILSQSSYLLPKKRFTLPVVGCIKYNLKISLSSGLTLYGDYRVQEVNEVTTSSNSVLLHFYSDLAYNMSGFNISYR